MLFSGGKSGVLAASLSCTLASSALCLAQCWHRDLRNHTAPSSRAASLVEATADKTDADKTQSWSDRDRGPADRWGHEQPQVCPGRAAEAACSGGREPGLGT